MTDFGPRGRIVVGIDGTAPSQAALRWAVRRAERDERELVLAHVVDDDFGEMGSTFGAEARNAARELLDRTASEVAAEHPHVTVSTALTDGSVAWALAHAVGPADLLVIGTHKTGYLHGRVLGSRSVQIATAAPCDVAVIPDVELRFRRGVVAGVDRAVTAESVARSAALEAAGLGDEVLFLHATPRMPGAPVESARAGTVHNDVVTTAVRAARTVQPQLEIRARIAHRDPAEVLLDAARDRALLVLGPGSLEPTRSPIGSVLHDVLLNVNAPVLIARTGSGPAVVDAGAHIGATTL